MARKIYTDEKTGAKVYRDSANNQYYVVGKDVTLSHPSTYYTDDKQDAINTAASFLGFEVNQELSATYQATNSQLIKELEEDLIIQKAKAIIKKRLTFTRYTVSNANDSKAFCSIELHKKEREIFGVLFLDNQNRLIEYKELFMGTIDSASVYPREVVKEALKLNASSLILTHNHPSGLSLPSEADKRLTVRIKEACALVDLRVLDHIIVGEENFSFVEAGLM